MVFVSRCLVALAVGGLFSAPLYADVIPSRRADTSTSDASRKVESRLMELGLTQDAAVAHTQQLTDRETAFFAQNPERVQIAGQEIWAGQTDLLWWEWVFGIVAIVGAGILIWYELVYRD